MNEYAIKNTWDHLIDVQSSEGLTGLAPADRPVILPGYTAAYLLAPQSFYLHPQLARFQLTSYWDQRQWEDFYRPYASDTLYQLLRRFAGSTIGPYTEAYSQPRHQLIQQLAGLHNHRQLIVVDLSPLLPEQSVMAFNGSSMFAGASASPPRVALAGSLLGNSGGQASAQDKRHEKAIVFPRTVYFPGSGPVSKTPVKLASVFSSTMPKLPCLSHAASQQASAQWEDKQQDFQYRYTTDPAFNFEIFYRGQSVALYSIDQERSADNRQWIYDVSGAPIAKLSSEGEVEALTDQRQSDWQQRQFAQQCWQQIIYLHYRQQQGRLSFQQWVARDASIADIDSRNKKDAR